MDLHTAPRYQSLLFKRGFIFSDQPVHLPHPHWQKVEIGGYWLGYDPAVSFTRAQQEQVWGVLLGMVLDLFAPEASPEEILSRLLRAWQSADKDFYDYLDMLSGRFILFLGCGKDVYVFQDACGMRSVFYSTQHACLASHLQLLATHLPEVTLDERFAGLLDKYTSYHLPGVYTPYQHILTLTPNTCLRVPAQTVQRFFPRAPLSLLEPEQVYAEIAPLLSRQITTLTKKFKLLTSLSAGLDSRATLALLKNDVSEVLFFTYFKENDNGEDDMNSRVLNIDRDTAADIAANLNLPYTLLPLDYAEINSADYQDFESILKENTYLHHNYYLAYKYLLELPNDRLHLRSNINEIFKHFYRKQMALPESISAQMMAVCYAKNAAEDTFVQSCFQDFIETVKFEQCLNYDPYDLFYWEYRLGVWHSSVLLESDIAHDTFCLFNNRWLLTRILALPPSRISEFYILHRLIDENWPILNHWPINGITTEPQPLLPGGLSLQNVQIEGYSLNYSALPVHIHKEDQQVLFYLDVNAPKTGDRAVLAQTLNVEPRQGYFLSLEMQSPYLRRKLHGRIRYEVLLDGVMIGSEDVADWDNPNLLQIVFQAQQPVCRIVVQVIAQKDCEPWHWGQAARVILGNLRLEKANYSGAPAARASSPFMQISVTPLTIEILSCAAESER